MSISTERRATLTRGVKDEARRLGFEAVAIARADAPLDADYTRYEAFIDAGYHGEMAYLADDREVRARLDGPGMLAGAKSVVCLARSYKRSDASDDAGLAASVARYARGQDYHNGLRKKLRKLASFVRGLEEGAEARPLVDDAPILERAWAARAGLGFIGKNGLLIVPGHGSFVLLGEVITTLELDADEPLPGRCGSCTLCLDACPTGAFPRPFVLDAKRCIAYLTIEAKDLAPLELRAAIGDRVYGCDTCQDVCPFNAGRGEGADVRAFRPHAKLEAMSVIALLDLDEAAFVALKEGSPLGRPGRDGLRRNAALVLAARDDEASWAALSRHVDDPSPVVREAVRWAASAIAARRAAHRG